MAVTIINPEFLHRRNDLPCKIIVDCAASVAGTVLGSLAAHYTNANPLAPPLYKITGKIKKVQTAPGNNGDLTTYLPTDQYDLTLTDEYGYEVTASGIGNRSGTISESIVPVSDIVVDSELILTGSNCGNNGKFRVTIFLGR
jgi:hypothetical protein